LKPPKCPICGVTEWNHTCSDPEPVGDSVEEQETGQVARNRRWRQKNREKYNAYMRAYRRREKE